MEQVFAPCHRMHGGATGQPIPTFADGCQFDALEELFIQIYDGGQASSINQVQKTIFCQRKQNVETIPHHRMPYSNIPGGQCSRQVYDGP